MNRRHIKEVILTNLFDWLDVLLNETFSGIFSLLASQNSYKTLLLVNDFGLLDNTSNNDFLTLLGLFLLLSLLTYFFLIILLRLLIGLNFRYLFNHNNSFLFLNDFNLTLFNLLFLNFVIVFLALRFNVVLVDLWYLFLL